MDERRVTNHESRITNHEKGGLDEKYGCCILFAWR